eukprot:143067-Prorocentrum_minimum.AAC.1
MVAMVANALIRKRRSGSCCSPEIGKARLVEANAPPRSRSWQSPGRSVSVSSPTEVLTRPPRNRPYPKPGDAGGLPAGQLDGIQQRQPVD